MDKNNTKEIEFTKDDARSQLSSNQQLRTHWSGIITNHLGLALTINIAIISYFLKAYIDSIYTGVPQYTLLFALSALTSIIFGLWRLYAHYIDNSIANLYPDFLKCEYSIGLSEKEGTMKYLHREIKKAQYILDDENISHVDKIVFLTKLIDYKRISTRGHFSIDLFTIIIQIILIVSSFIVSCGHLTGFDFSLSIVAFSGIIITLVGVFRFQKRTRQKDVEKALI